MDEGNIESCKIVLLGESGVGKTSIINQFIEESFSDEERASSGASFFTKEICLNDTKLVKLEIWDTAGQEKYRALSRMFYKDAGIALLIYDINRKESFEEIKKYWITQVKEYSPKKIILALVANKSDLYDTNEQVSEQLGRDLAKEIGASFYSTTAKDTGCIYDLFESVVSKYCDPNWVADSEAEKEFQEYKQIKRGTVRVVHKKEEDKKSGCCLFNNE